MAASRPWRGQARESALASYCGILGELKFAWHHRWPRHSPGNTNQFALVHAAFFEARTVDQYTRHRPRTVNEFFCLSPCFLANGRLAKRMLRYVIKRSQTWTAHRSKNSTGKDTDKYRLGD